MIVERTFPKISTKEF